MEAVDIEITYPSPPPAMCEQLDAMRIPVPSISEYELESRRKASPTVAARRKELTTYVASLVGVAWFLCIFAIGQSALHEVLSTMAHH